MYAVKSTASRTTGIFFGTVWFIAGSQAVTMANEPPDSSDLNSKAQSVVENHEPKPSSPEGNLDGPLLYDTSKWSEILRALVLTAIPDKYEDLRNWDKTNEVFGGIRIQQRGLNIRVQERKRKVNHGAWHRYKIELIDPAKTLKLVFDHILPAKANQFEFDLRLAAKLRCRGDFENWVFGVKGLNFTVVSEAEVQIVANCQVAIRTETRGKSLLPDLVIEPQVKRVQLFLTSLDIRRIGEIRGDVAEWIGDISRHDIENLIQAQESRVLKKANEAIEKKRKSLRLPTSKLW